MVSTSEIILEYVCPSLGLIGANLMFLAPLRDLQKAVTKGHGLGDLNPTPWAVMLGNCIGWSSYGVLTSNWFVFWANYPGFLIACWLNLGAVKLMYASHHRDEARRSLVDYLSSSSSKYSMTKASLRDEEKSFLGGDTLTRDEESNDNQNDKDSDNTCELGNGLTEKHASPPIEQTDGRPDTGKNDWAKIVWDVTSQTTPAKTPHERLVVGMVLLWSLLLSAIGFYKHYASIADTEGTVSNSDKISQSIVGYVVNFNLVFFYGAPLSAIGRVLKTRRSNTLHIPTMAMNTFNSVFWTAYALAPQINDPFIYIPNGLGVILGVIQFFLWMVFPRTPLDETSSNRPASTSLEIKHGETSDAETKERVTDVNPSQ